MNRSPTPAIRAFLEPGVTGLLVPVGDAEAMASAIESLLTQADLAERISRNACEAVGEYTYAVRAEKVERFALEVLA